MTTTTPPTRPAADGADDAASTGFAARVSLGRVFAPVPSEFLLIASTALLLTGFGLTMVLSATMATALAGGQSPFEVVMKQAVFAVIGIPLMFVASRLPVTFWKRVAWPGLILATLFQLLVFVPGLGVANDGNQNWIQIAGFQAQPSEFLKVTLALWLGYVLYRKQTLLGLWRHVFIPVVPVGALVIGTVMAGHDLGTAMILMVILLACLFFSGVNALAFAEIPESKSSQATPITSVAQQVSIALGVAMAGGILEVSSSLRGMPLALTDFHIGFFIVAGISAIAFLWFSRLAPDAGQELAAPTVVKSTGKGSPAGVAGSSAGR